MTFTLVPDREADLDDIRLAMLQAARRFETEFSKLLPESRALALVVEPLPADAGASAEVERLADLTRGVS